jgi:hypothetical protein
MRTLIKGILKFGISFVILTIVCSIVWLKLVDGTIYNNTDGTEPFDYVFPHCWVGNDGNYPLVTVKHVVPDGVMQDPDTILTGWTVTRLWYLWATMFAAQLGASVLLARLNWPPILGKS